MLDAADFKARVALEPWKAIMEVADFNSLIALSQDFQVPVYALTSTQIDQQGAVWAQTKQSMETFEAAFKLCAERVFALTA